MKTSTKKWLILIGLAGLTMVWDGCCFSPGLLGWSLTDTRFPLEMAGAWVSLFFTCIGLPVLAWTMLTEKKSPDFVHPQKPDEKYCLERIRGMDDKCFREQQELLKKQIRRMEDKNAAARKMLEQYFGDARLTLTKYLSVLESVHEYFYDCVLQILNRMDAFDYEDYQSVMETGNSSRMEPYEEHLRFIKNRMADLDDILVRTDRLITELLKLTESGDKNQDSLEIRQMEELIANTSAYKA